MTVHATSGHEAYQKLEMGFVRVADIKFDREAYQRETIESWVDELGDMFDPAKAGAVILASNDDGTYDAVEGQHRVIGAERKHGPDFLIPAVVWHGMSIEDRAEQFGAQNDRKPIKPHEKYRAALRTGRDHSVIGTQQVLEARKLCVSHLAGADNIRGASGLVSAYDDFGPEALGRALDTLEAAFGRRPETWMSGVIKGLSQFYSTYPKARDQRLVEVLRKSNVIGCSRDLFNLAVHTLHSGGGGGSRSRRVARTAQQLYDAGLPIRSKLVKNEL